MDNEKSDVLETGMEPLILLNLPSLIVLKSIIYYRKSEGKLEY